jgi:hypothetical protein
MNKWDIILHSDYSPDTCVAKLSEQIDSDKRSLFSLSGYKGSKPIVGRVGGNEFRLHKRRYWHNSFGPVLFGRVTSHGRGSLVEGYWDMARWTRMFTRVWIIFAIVVGTPILFDSLRCIGSVGCRVQGDWWVGIVVPPALVLWGLLLPRLGATLSFHERKRVAQLLEQILVAGPTGEPQMERSWESSLDGYDLWV